MRKSILLCWGSVGLFKWIKIIMCALLIFALAGCQRTQTDEVVTKKNQALQGPSAITTKSDTLRLSMGKPETLNPLENTDVSVDKVLRLLFEPLFVQNQNNEIQPNLAESYSVENNGNTVNIKLRSGLKWDDGNPITASDIVYSVKFLQKAGDNVIYKSNVKNVKSCYAKDNLTATITYSQPVGAVVYSLCFPIVSKHYYGSGTGSSMKPVGNGLYKFSDYTLVKEMNLVASKNFNTSPLIPKVNVIISDDEETSLNALEHNVIDALTVDTSKLGKLSSDMASNAAVYSTNKFEFLGLNLKKNIFADINARQALAHLMPTNEIVNNVYINRAVKSITPINPSNSCVSGIGVDSYDYNETTANTLILACGLTKSDFAFTILVNDDNAERKKTANIISKKFNANGLNTRVEAVPFETYAQRIADGEYDTFIGGVELSGNMDLTSLLMSSSTPENNGSNYFGYADANMDRLIGIASSSADIDSYKTAINELNKYCSSQLPLLGICFRSEALVTNNVTGLKTPSDGNVYGNMYQWTMK